MKFTIKRSEWLRGEGSSNSFLIRNSDSKKCCLGFFGLACGIEEEHLVNFADPSDSSYVSKETKLKWHKGIFGPGGTTKTCRELMETNDQEDLLDREDKIKELFKSIDIDVEFVD